MTDPIEELKIAQDVITHQETLTFKVFSWTVGIVTALTIGLFHERVEINGWVYMSTGLVTISTFLLVAREHWGTFYVAIRRSGIIEKEIKNNSYSGFSLNKELSDAKKINILKVPRLYLPYLALAIIVLVSGFFKIIMT